MYIIYKTHAWHFNDWIICILAVNVAKYIIHGWHGTGHPGDIFHVATVTCYIHLPACWPLGAIARLLQRFLASNLRRFHLQIVASQIALHSSLHSAASMVFLALCIASNFLLSQASRPELVCHVMLKDIASWDTCPYSKHLKQGYSQRIRSQTSLEFAAFDKPFLSRTLWHVRS